MRSAASVMMSWRVAADAMSVAFLPSSGRMIFSSSVTSANFTGIARVMMPTCGTLPVLQRQADVQ